LKIKAWRIEKHGGVEVLQRKDLDLPDPGPMQVRVKVQAVALNHLDLWVRKGVPGHKFPLPMTPGCDVVGKVAALGPGSAESLAKDGIQVGSEVVVSPGVSCGHCEACLSGFDPLCPSYGIIGETMDGGCADFINVSVANLILKPASLSVTQAAALLIPYLTAWTMLVRKAQLKPGENVLVHAGGSGVSIACIEIAKMLGATVITTVGTDDKIAKAKQLGADHVINYKQTRFRDELKKIGKKVSIVVDHVGSETFAESIKSLTWGGRLVTCGATSGPMVEIDLRHIFFKNISILGTTMGSKGDLHEILNLAAQGKLKPVIDHVYPMDQLPQAHERLESRAAFGKLVVTQ
jgi:NADPH:quinone reductase-like Zn-dependent oxidoreductase